MDITNNQTNPYRYDYEIRKLLGIGEFANPKKVSGGSNVSPSDDPQRKFYEVETFEVTEDNETYTYRIDDMKQAAVESGQMRQKLAGKGNIEFGKKAPYSQARYQYMINAPFNVSNACCKVMKKAPFHTYSHETGNKPMTAQMTDESRLRLQAWYKNGCNGFDMKEPISNPMSFWTEQDVLRYIKENDIELASIYGDVIEDDKGNLKTTGAARTGCMFCGYGCHRDKPGQERFLIIKETHPKLYEYIMKPWDCGGLNYKEVIDWMNEHGRLDIKY